VVVRDDGVLRLRVPVRPSVTKTRPHRVLSRCLLRSLLLGEQYDRDRAAAFRGRGVGIKVYWEEGVSPTQLPLTYQFVIAIFGQATAGAPHDHIALRREDGGSSLRVQHR